MKRVACLFVFVLFLAGCGKSYDEDFTETYKDVLDEMLGQWKVVEEREVEGMYKPFYVSERKYTRWKLKYLTSPDKPFYVPTVRYLGWELEYTDAYGEKHSVTIYNDYPIQEDLIADVFNKLTDDFERKVYEDLFVSVEDPYLRVGDLEREYFTKHYDTIKKLYGDKILLQNAKVEDVFEGTPIYARIKFNKENFQHLTDAQFNQLIDVELKELLAEIPFLNAHVSIINEYSEEMFTARHFIQGKELEVDKDYLGDQFLRITLKKHFPEYQVLEPKEKYKVN
ncbi:hypothetical protein [Bacillus dakarensis]|uniref:hypothetical protein n=1 Tax=Robertmurraya dakarensis TaxID=1926278 RepID=UPI0009816B11|nr:hypothetical protein [Bacillus dakarensis]